MNIMKNNNFLKFNFMNSCQVVIVEHKACIPSCPRLPPTREEMEDWIKIGKVIRTLYNGKHPSGLCIVWTIYFY